MFTYIRCILTRNDVRIFIICTATGAVLQLVAKTFLGKHPKILEEKPKLPLPRGGALIEITGVGVEIGLKVLVKILAEKGIFIGIVTGAGAVAISKIPTAAVASIVRDALPQNLSHLEAKKFIQIDGEKIYIDNCDNTFQFLFKILEDESIPFERKQKIAREAFKEYLDLSTVNGRIRFVLCIVVLLVALAKTSPGNYLIMIKNLLQAVKEGRITKSMARYIIRKLKQKNIPIDPELIDLVGD